MGYFCSLPGKVLDPPGNEAPTISRRSQAEKGELGQQLVPHPMVKRASQPPPQGHSGSNHQGEAGVPVSSGTALRAATGSKGTVSGFRGSSEQGLPARGNARRQPCQVQRCSELPRGDRD